jgi:hypothetical protein
MTVKKLIEELQQYDEGTEVHFAYNYGDHWHTRVAPAVDSVEELYVKHSEYHSMPVLVDEEDEDYGGKGQTSVIVLS